MLHFLRIFSPKPPGFSDISVLRGFVAAEQKQNNGAALFPKIGPIARTEQAARFPNASTNGLVVADVARFKM
jgi:hypothetical protein